ncbi:unnamed protein product [Arabis nemorensis]|uniref:GATA transcription factor n=1 Tax=Arabis nemorensis TaxID=586526 RepID=A0A565BVB9_9BRAS|nr:unnamed protein product [Arabis nemorensis]
MESVELALKNSNRKEKTLTGGAQNGEDFSVDDLFDFSNDDVFSENDEAELKVMQRKKGGASVSVNDENTLHRSNDSSTAGEDDLVSLPTSELAVPMDDLAELEWLSNFVEETNKYFSPYSPPTEKPVWLTGNRKHPVPPVNKESCVKPPLPVKTRAKRARTKVTVFTDSSSSSTTTSSSSSSGLSNPSPWLSGADHCGVQKTPQWREGPMGTKTLCNACGVRFKSGRLLPEYRPACSPTFSSELHSNHHRKVVEMRRKKEMSTMLMEPV